LILAPVGLVLALAAGAPAKGCTVGSALKEGQQRALQRTAMAHLERIRLMAGVKAKAELLCDKWGRVRAVPPAGKSADSWLLLHRDTNGWRVVLGPAATFTPEELAKAGAPATIWPPR
jgi:hypothetical protein